MSIELANTSSSLEAPSLKAIREKLEATRVRKQSQWWDKVCIYRIRANLRASNEELYIPRAISIGPYHRGQENLEELETHKWRALLQALERTGKDVTEFLDAMGELEERARACYEKPLNNITTSSEFTEMMMLDGCFILDIFVGTSKGFTELGYPINDFVFSKRSTMMLSIKSDMLMLENQLPLFVLNKLLEIQTGGTAPNGSVAKLAIQFFDTLMPSYWPHNININDAWDQEELHCLDVIRRNILRVKEAQPQGTQGNSWFDVLCQRIHMLRNRRRSQFSDDTFLPCVTNLKNAGIKFKLKVTNKFWDITFDNGVIYMPKIVILPQKITTSLLFNLVAFEQYHMSIPWASCTLSAYVLLLDMLIDTAEDITYLRSQHIIDHTCGSDAEAAKQVALPCEGSILYDSEAYLHPLVMEINAYYKHRWNVWWENLKQQYFNNPWAIISFMAGVLIFLTLAKTFYAIYSHHWPH